MNYGVTQLAQKTVTTAGTAVQLDTTGIRTRSVVIQALSTNAGAIYVGDADVDSTHAIHLAPGASIVIEAPGSPVAFIDLSTIWIDAAQNDEQVNVLYLEKV